MPCHKPTSFLKSRTFTMVSAADREGERWIKWWPGDWTRCVWVCICVFTLGVAAGLGESLAVCEQSDPGHRDAQNAAVLTGFILREKQQTDHFSFSYTQKKAQRLVRRPEECQFKSTDSLRSKLLSKCPQQTQPFIMIACWFPCWLTSM